MKYKNMYDKVEAIYYDGYNFKEVSDFCGNRLSWTSEETSWSDNNPPEDLVVTLDDKVLTPKNYVVKLGDGNYEIMEEYDFSKLFEETEDGE